MLQDTLTAAKKKRIELESVASKLIYAANKKAKEAEKKSSATDMKTLLIESNASREKGEKMKAKDIPAQEREIKDIEDKLKKLD